MPRIQLGRHGGEMNYWKTKEEERVLGCIKKWLDIKGHNQQGIDPYKYSLFQLPADIDHSDLLGRLLQGEEPLPEPPD